MSAADAIVVGAGPTGALTALGLAQRGCSVTLLEAEPAVVDSPRAIVYYWHVLLGLERLGVLEDMDRRGFRNAAFLQRVLQTGDQADIALAPVAAISDYAYNLHLGQHEVVRIALEHLSRMDNATIRFGTRMVDLADDGVGVTVKAQDGDGDLELRGSWLIGADGARSAIRSAIGSGFEGMTWPDRFVATNLRYPFDELGGLGNANMLIDPEHGCVIARIDRSGLWRWTWSEPAELPEATVGDRLSGRLAALGFGDAPFAVDAFTPYRMHQRSADRMRDGRVLLVGDAAHATNPTGGLGLTSGMYDLFALVDPLAAVVAGDADEAVLDDWADERLRIFREHASPMATNVKRLVYDEADLAKRQGAVRAAADQRDPEMVLRRLTGMTVLNSGLPSAAPR